ncbi:MAG: ornithine carbamoyltransferase [Bosea sp. (in: a-proteobacteria)]
MPMNLKGRSLLSLDDVAPDEIRFLLKLAAELKAAKHAGTEIPRLTRKNIALIFEKDSTRTRTGFEVAAYDQGAHVTYLGPTGTQIGHKESMKDTARVLGRMYDAIEYRGSKQTAVEQLARHAGVPVYNGLTNEAHPTQVLADFLTMREFTHKHLSDMALVFMGDIHNNVARSLALGARKVGIDMRLCGPATLRPDKVFVDHLHQIAQTTGAKLTVTEDVHAAVAGADFVYTDVWLSMGENRALWGERIKLLMPYQVNSALMHATGNPHATFMHCLPAVHDTETEVGAEIAKEFGVTGLEVSDEVFESRASIVFDQAENRMHSIKAVLLATIGG